MGYAIAAVPLLVGLFRLGLYTIGFVHGWRRRELTFHEIRYFATVVLTETGALILLGMHLLLSAMRDDYETGVLLTTAGILILVSILLRIALWLDRVLRPMSPELIAAASEAQDILERLSVPAGQGALPENGKVESTVRRLREALAPYRERR